MLKKAFVVAAVALTSLAVMAPPSLAVLDAGPATPAAIIAKLNKQRRQNGLPAGITQNQKWTSGCRKHDRYMDRNNVITHYEKKGKPGYTEDGEWAGQNSVLSMGATWRDGNVFDEAPIHLAQLLQPRLHRVGAFELEGRNSTWGCVTTWPGFTRPYPKTNRVYTYPGDRTTGVPTELDASTEGPCSTNDIVGISDRAGQQLFLFADGPAVESDPWGLFDITRARLRAVGKGAVAIKVADGVTDLPSNCGSGKLGSYLGPGGAGVVIPVKALKPETTYSAEVTLEGNGVTLQKAWTFTTEKS